MFHQILHFLALKEEFEQLGEEKIKSQFKSEEEIQKVIFDKDYLKYMKKKLKSEVEG